MRRAIGIVTLGVLAAACGRSGAGVKNADVGSFRVVGVGASVDPTIHPARLVPERVEETTSFGSEPGAGTRMIAAGLRLAVSPKGAVVAADDRFSAAPTLTTALPDRLGGGFLYVIGNTVWRSDRWLSAAKPIFTSGPALVALIPGLDRVYLRTQTTTLAIDARTGRALDLGPWPASPLVTSYAAADGWRAAAVTDLRGVVATYDAGATWRSIDPTSIAVPLDAKKVVVTGDSLAIGGFEDGKQSWFELRADGSLARLSTAPREARGVKLAPSSPQRTSPSSTPAPRGAAPLTPITESLEDDDGEDTALKTFGKRPLSAAIEDGWPLTDGTAVVARDGTIARIRLADGALVEVVRDAFPLKPAHCHPVSLTRPSAAGAFGFVCGEPRGATVIYAYDPMRGRLAEIKRFDRPRVVTSSGNGALAVRGACAEDAEPPPPAQPETIRIKDHEEPEGGGAKPAVKPKEPPPAPKAPPPRGSEIHPYCVLGYDNTWREIHVRGDVAGERVVVLADGRIVVVSPPQELGTPARLTVLDKGKATTVPVTFPRVTNDVARALRLGMWLDGFEERRPGVIGGWIEGGGVMLGLELAIDGSATIGQYIRDAGLPFVSGRYGLGWTASRRGYETIDGGMTWTPIELPEPLAAATKVERRACGPIGCIASGWLRVGWGEAKREPPPTVPPAYRPQAPLLSPTISLVCDPIAPAPPKPPERPARTIEAPIVTPRPRVSLSSPPVLGSFPGLTDLRPFMHQPAPVLKDPDRGIDIDVHDSVERVPALGSVARVYGWGPKTGEWETLGHWQVKWLSPFAGWPELRASLPAPPPPMIVDMTKLGASYYSPYSSFSSNNAYQLAPGDDAAHALLVGRRAARGEVTLFEVEADRVPIEVRRADGEPFGDIEGVTRAAGRWFVSSPPVLAPGSTALVTILWQIEGGVARELTRVPRALGDSGTSANRAKLARRSDGRALGLVVEGQPTIERASAVRWVLPVDLESGALGEPEPLGYVDLAGRTLEGCADDVIGWVIDANLPQPSVRIKLPSGSGSIGNVHARMRLTGSRVCIERLAGSYDGQTPERAAQLTRGGASVSKAAPTPRPGELIATAVSMHARHPLRCTVAR